MFRNDFRNRFYNLLFLLFYLLVQEFTVLKQIK